MVQIWARLLDRLASIDGSTSMIEVTSDYAAHFYDMYVKNHDGKHMTRDRIKILLLNLPFMLRDLILPEVLFTTYSCRKRYRIQYRINFFYKVIYDILYEIVYDMMKNVN